MINNFFAIMILILILSFSYVINYKVYLSTKIFAARKNKKYEGFIIESFYFDQIKNYLFTMVPYFMTIEDCDSDLIINFINRYNKANKVYLILFIIFIVLAIFTFIFTD